MDAKAHWESVYQTKRADRLSWFQPRAEISLDLIRRVAPDRTARVIDVGGGASVLVDGLLGDGYSRIAVMDLSPAALKVAQARLGTATDAVEWIEGDVLSTALPERAFDVWHDRAVFHFLTAPADRGAYIAQVCRTVRPRGHVLVATFAEDGPTKCSGLSVARYSAGSLHGEFGDAFRLIDSMKERHVTPSGATQSFVYCLCQFVPRAGHRAA